MKIIVFFQLLVLTTAVAYADKKGPKKDQEPPEVFVQEVQPTELFTPLEFGGFIVAKEQRAISPEIDGTIRKIVVQLGQRVTNGQVLFSVTPRGAGLNYRRNLVRSPIDGVVTAIDGQQGSAVNAGQSVLTIVDPSERELEVQITYQDREIVIPGTKMNVVIGSTKVGKELRTVGVVKSVSPAAHAELGTFPAVVSLQCNRKAECLNQFPIGGFARTVFKSQLRQGIKLDAKFLVNQRREAIVLTAEDTAKFVPVKTGAFFGAEVEVVSGLKKGDRVVTNFSKFPKPEQKVVIKSKAEEKEKIFSESSGKESAKAE